MRVSAAGNMPLQGLVKPPAKPVVMILFPKNWSGQAELAERRVFGTNDPSALHPQTDRLWYNRGVKVTRKDG